MCIRDSGQTIRLNFPAPTEERRKQLAKEVSKLGEEAKVAVRNILSLIHILPPLNSEVGFISSRTPVKFL